MKKILLVILIALSSFANAFTANSQSNFNKNKNNYFVITRNIGQLKPIILAAENLAKQDGKKYGLFHVVICGKAVLDLIDSDKTKPFLTLAKQHHVQIFACGFSLNKFDVPMGKLPSQVEAVDNGILYGFELQKKGFYSITL